MADRCTCGSCDFATCANQGNQVCKDSPPADNCGVGKTACCAVSGGVKGAQLLLVHALFAACRQMYIAGLSAN